MLVYSICRTITGVRMYVHKSCYASTHEHTRMHAHILCLRTDHKLLVFHLLYLHCSSCAITVFMAHAFIVVSVQQQPSAG